MTSLHVSTTVISKSASTTEVSPAQLTEFELGELGLAPVVEGTVTFLPVVEGTETGLPVVAGADFPVVTFVAGAGVAVVAGFGIGVGVVESPK